VTVCGSGFGGAGEEEEEEGGGVGMEKRCISVHCRLSVTEVKQTEKTHEPGRRLYVELDPVCVAKAEWGDIFLPLS